MSYVDNKYVEFEDLLPNEVQDDIWIHFFQLKISIWVELGKLPLAASDSLKINDIFNLKTLVHVISELLVRSGSEGLMFEFKEFFQSLIGKHGLEASSPPLVSQP